MSHDVVSVLLDILVVLVAAKVAAEVAERIHVPAVVGEIVAGILIGPSVLDLVGGGDVLLTLGELGVVLLLLEVGMEMDLGELGKVGRASLQVATIGVLGPLLLGFGAMTAIGNDFNTALFVAAALTATSVGITARVFGDLGALATTEARVVLGAAVADDVMGLVVLTVVVRVVTEGTVSVVDVLVILLVAVAFLVVGGAVALFIAPPLFSQIERHARSAGTVVALALAFTLAFAELADVAKLAVVVGAFLAGLALGRSTQSDRIRRELAPVGHLFIPVFFLQIGIDVDVSSFGRFTVLRDAAILLVVAVVGKLIACVGTVGTPSDKLLIGLGMLPRGEVGLIFATIGLASGVLDNDLYAALLLVVLATTLVTPVLLRRRYERLGSTAVVHEPGTRSTPPPGGWLQIIDGELELSARPAPHLTLQIALDAARYVADARPSEDLLDWFSSTRDAPLLWSPAATTAFLALLTKNNVRSWRFLDALNVLPRALPELADALRERRDDPFELDYVRLHRWDTLERLAEFRTSEAGTTEWSKLVFPDRVQLAAFLLDVLRNRDDRLLATRKFVSRLQYGASAEQEIATLVDDPDLMLAMASQRDGLGEDAVLRLAVQLGGPETARAAFLLAGARDTDRERNRSRLAELHRLVQTVLADPRVGPEAENLVVRHRAEASRLVGDDAGALERVADAPRAYVMSESPGTIARHALMISRWHDRRGLPVLLEVTDRSADGDGWRIDVVAADRPGLLAKTSAALASAGYDISRAVVATWPRGPAVETFVVTGDRAPEPSSLAAGIEAASTSELTTPPLAGAEVEFDETASPWYTVCEVRAPDRRGLLSAIAGALAAAGVDVHSADIAAAGAIAADRFEVSGPGGRVNAATRATIQRNLRDGVELTGPRKRFTAVKDRVLAAFTVKPAER